MSETVKSRAARTRATRRRIVDAAAELFIERGYGVTTLEQIAARAGVAVQTVYFHFGNKRTVLKEAVDVAAVGDDEQVALLERPWLGELRAGGRGARGSRSRCWNGRGSRSCAPRATRAEWSSSGW